MRQPRPRFTVGWLMVIVAAVAVPCLLARSVRFGQVAAWHRHFEYAEAWQVATSAGPEAIPMIVDVTVERRRWHSEMRTKYERAAGQPWLSVAPDSPEPD